MRNNNGRAGWGCLGCVAERPHPQTYTVRASITLSTRDGARRLLASSRTIERPSAGEFGTASLNPTRLVRRDLIIHARRMGSSWVRMLRHGAASADRLRHEKRRDLRECGIARYFAARRGISRCDL